MSQDIKKRLFDAASRRRKTVTLGSGDSAVEVDVMSLSGNARGRILNSCVLPTASVDDDDDADEEIGADKMDMAKMGPELVIECTVHKGTSDKVFAEADRDMIGESDAAFFDPIIKTASELSGLGKSAAKTAEGNS